MRQFILSSVLVFATGAASLGQSPPDSLWKKVVLDTRFRSEGVAVADVNRDGLLDVLAGDVWYQAPDWKMHPIRRIKDFASVGRDKGLYGDGLSSYSECMCCWADDLNGDGWPDQIVIGFPGKAAYWYENPRGQPGPWKEHVIWHSACNETPLYVDLFNSGKRVLVMGCQPIRRLVADANSPLAERKFDLQPSENLGEMAWFAPGADPTALWEKHSVSGMSTSTSEVPGTRRFSHGLGVGDVNGDGRLDIICTGGWWEQPAEAMKSNSAWTFHAANLGDACANMIVVDIDGDGKPDVITSSAHQFGIWAFSQRSESAFARKDLFPKLVSETHAMQFADIDGDGLNDLITGKRFWSHGRNEPGSSDPAKIYWFKATKATDGVLTYSPKLIDDDSGIGTQFTVIDINGDGKLDVVTANKKGVFILYQPSNSSGRH